MCATAPTATSPFSTLDIQIPAHPARSRGAVCKSLKCHFVGGNADRLISKGTTLNWDIIEGNWKQFQGHVKEKWGKLTDDNLDAIAGKRGQLAGKLQETYGITKDQTEVQLKAFEAAHKDYQPTPSV
jgi:uncharacterized protein YjbJ (UPF0337 family)